MLDASTMADARARAEELMTDTCVVRRPTGNKTQDTTTLTVADELADVLTSKCKLQMPTVIARPQEAGGRTTFMVRLELCLPIGLSATVQADDAVTITAVGALSDTHLLGRKFRVVGPPAKSIATAFRVEVQEYT